MRGHCTWIYSRCVLVCEFGPYGLSAVRSKFTDECTDLAWTLSSHGHFFFLSGTISEQLFSSSAVLFLRGDTTRHSSIFCLCQSLFLLVSTLVIWFSTRLTTCVFAIILDHVFLFSCLHSILQIAQLLHLVMVKLHNSHVHHLNHVLYLFWPPCSYSHQYCKHAGGYMH